MQPIGGPPGSAGPPPTSPEETLFVSDLHLAPERPATIRLFLDFLRGRARQARRLYILGDLFDAWVGDDDDTPPYPEIRAALRDLTASGTACAIMHGNRDFLLGRAFCRDTGCGLLRDPTRITLDRESVLLMHGDLLCTDDVAYQRFRRRIRNPLVKRLFLWRPLGHRRAVAADYRRRSGAATAEKATEIMDVNPGTVERYMR
ncbi:MAG: UDP-2,3-diacylglucosamine diphosphatase, partial [Bdellovibrio bacteriovorus]